MIRNFDDLLEMARLQDQPQRLLLLLVKTDSAGPGKRQRQTGTITPMACVDKLPDEIKSFESFVAEADQVSKDWDMIFVASMSGTDGRVPSSADAEPHLDRMTNDLLTGQDLSRYLILDREENIVTMQPSQGAIRI